MKRAGFTLIEVLVALVVAVAAMALLSQGFTTGARASTTAQFATRAAMLAQRVLTDFETGQLALTSNQSGGFEDEPDFTYETTAATGSITGLTQLTIRIKWQERNQDRSYELVRLMKDRPTTSTGSTTSPSSSSTTPPK
ncbi:MAG TPA: prepilin-type N-terminal cleavage/methylation domain-containing protein [Planctomycetota bacterium]|jgi:prepilin-type N-terminal cleavage/methylation domain-containing protein|nr:prepilin-type N-terminal cleavage/methylation domain-containing protein [Planctomycetota bacterium]